VIQLIQLATPPIGQTVINNAIASIATTGYTSLTQDAMTMTRDLIQGRNISAISTLKFLLGQDG
jgi:hypothetical protein